MNICEPFYTTKGKDKGTGLGLATVYGIVKQSKGQIAVFSEPGTSTTIKMYFPVAELRIIVGKGFSKESSNELGSGNIVLVEDDEAVRNLTKRILESNGYIVNEFESAEEALEMIASIANVGLVLTDIVMSGVELGKKLKVKFPGITIMYMSGFTGDALEDMNEREDDSLFISKPFTQNALLEKVKQHM
jgi:CheY-like chemotaxis protein